MFLTATITAVLALAPAMPGDADAQEAATEQAQPRNTGSDPDNYDADRRIHCRYEQQLHTRIPQRVCRTETQWAEIDRQAEEDRQAAMRRGGNRAESGAAYGAD